MTTNPTIEENPQVRTRAADQVRQAVSSTPKGYKTICVPLDEVRYSAILDEPSAYRQCIDELYGKHPELFPKAVGEGYTLHDKLPCSKKRPEMRLRRIKRKADKAVYTIRPSFVLPYMTGYTNDVENGIFLRNFGLPYWAVSHVCGKDDMYWQRLEVSFGRNRVVGTTVRTPDALPQDLVADEKHTSNNGAKTYVATTVGGECVLGAAMSPTAGEQDLTAAYGQFKAEAHNGFVYHQHWLHNLLIAASLAGFRP